MELEEMESNCWILSSELSAHKNQHCLKMEEEGQCIMNYTDEEGSCKKVTMTGLSRV